jgi:plasmid stabilization system protein ParE
VKVAYSEQALRDLVRLRSFIAEENPGAAARIAAGLVERLENLGRFPHLGRAVGPALGPDALRDVVFGNYIVRYAPRADVVIVLRIWHHHEDRLASR